MLKIANILSSVADKIDHPNASFCKKGQSWLWDEVRFEVLHPQQDDNLQGNNLSCVVRVSQLNYPVLLTGDIEYQKEQRLVDGFWPGLQSNVLVAPHYDSRTSSLSTFIGMVQADYMIFPVDYRNHFGFPKEDIIERYHKRQIKTLDTTRSEAIEVYTSKKGMELSG